VVAVLEDITEMVALELYAVTEVVAVLMENFPNVVSVVV
jgi:hypothetical protein